MNTRIHQATIDAGLKKSGQAFYDNTIAQIDGKSVSPNHAAELSIFYYQNPLTLFLVNLLLHHGMIGEINHFKKN